MINIDSNYNYSVSKELPKEYFIYKLRIYLNNELYENKIISYEIFKKMQRLLIQKMDKLLLNDNLEEL